MAALDRARRARPAWLLAGALAVTLTGCSSGSRTEPEPLPPATATRHRPEPSAVAAQPTPTPPPLPQKPASTTIVIESAEQPAEVEPSLVEAARTERERRTAITQPVVKLDNKNLGAFAADQKLTVAHPENMEGEDTPARAAETEPARAGSGEDERYWRDGARALRERWAFAVEEVGRLELESADLRRQFYAEDDPYVRDEQVKPEWDRVLNELDRARREAATVPRALEDFVESGRRAGALPGWLRDGMELEPEDLPETEGSKLGPAEPREPVVVEREPDDP